MSSTLIDKIDAVLPQTQCGLCGFNGCKPYATALVENNAAINLCPPGGIQGLMRIAALVEQDPDPFILDMQSKAKAPSVAIIREDECIGCTKCILACPVDAILGSAKQMHTIITDECTGCELCIAPCPVDCIDLKAVSPPQDNKADHYRMRYEERKQRLQNTRRERISTTKNPTILDKQAYIQAALLRAKTKK